jgi:hypothetical protein
MNFQKNSLFFLCLMVFVILFPSAGLTKSFISGETNLIKKKKTNNKYQVSAKIVPRQTMYRLEKPSPLTWTKDAQSSSSNSTVKDDNYKWNPDNDEALINIPIQNNFTQKDKIPKNLYEIQIDYQDFFPKNPSQFSLEMTVLEKETSTFEKSPPSWKKKTVTAMSSQLFPPIVKEDLFSSPIKKKNTLYLIKRELGFPFDLTWNYTQGKFIAKNHEDQTLFQRRFHMDLTSIEFIDIIFSDNVTEKDIKKFHCNFRITSTKGFGNRTIKRKVLRLGGKKVIRFNIGEYVRNTNKNSNIVFLEEMIIFLPGRADKIILERPIQSINFYKNNQITQRILQASLDVSSAQWIKKDVTYLFKHEIGFPITPSWRYYQEKESSVFERTLHKDLNEINSIDFILNNEVTTPDKMFCQLRVGFSDRPFPSKTINCDDLSKKIIKIDGQNLLRIDLHNLVHKFHPQGKRKIFLEEIKFYLTGPVNYYVKNKLLKTVRFFKVDRTNTHKICFYSSKPCSRTELLSPTHKRYIVNMTLMNDLIDKDAKLINLTLKIKAQNLKSQSKFKLNKARAIFQTKNQQLLSIASKDLAARWELYFSDRTNNKDFFEEVPVEKLFPISLTDLPINKVPHLDNWWDLGVKSIDPKFNLENKLQLPASSYLRTNYLFLEKIKPTAIIPNLTFGVQTPNPNLPTIQIGLFWRLSITFITIIILGWVSNTNRGRKFLHQFFSMTLINFRILGIEKYYHLYFLLSATFYLLGLLLGLRPYQNHLFTIGSIIFSLASYNFAKLNYYKIINVLPWSGEKIFIQKDFLLGSLFLFFLSTAALFKMATLDRVAEQAAGIGFIMLFTLVFLNIFKPSNKTNDLINLNNNKYL